MPIGPWPARVDRGSVTAVAHRRFVDLLDELYPDRLGEVVVVVGAEPEEALKQVVDFLIAETVAGL